MNCPACGYIGNSLGAERCKLCGASTSGGDHRSGGGSSPAPSPMLRKAPPPRHSDWQRIMLERPGATPQDLKPGARFVIGRVSECDLTIPSQRVSRNHAEIVWTGDKPLIRDLDSQNGVQINKRPVKEHKLADGDEITIGPYTCTFRSVSGVGSVAKLRGRGVEAPTIDAMGDSLAGNLEQVSLWEILDTLEHNGKTGTLEIFQSDGGDGSLALENGWPVRALQGELTGRDAVYALLSWEEGTFRFSKKFAEGPTNLKGVTINALMHEAHERQGN